MTLVGVSAALGVLIIGQCVLICMQRKRLSNVHSYGLGDAGGKRQMTTARILLTDYKSTVAGRGPNLGNRSELSKLIVELQGLLEEREKISCYTDTIRVRTAKALWLDRLAEIDY